MNGTGAPTGVRNWPCSAKLSAEHCRNTLGTRSAISVDGRVDLSGVLGASGGTVHKRFVVFERVAQVGRDGV